MRRFLAVVALTVTPLFLAGAGAVLPRAGQTDDGALRERLNRAMLDLEAADRLPAFSEIARLPAEALPALPTPSGTPLDGPALVERLRAATVMFHTAYKCGRCENWHGGVATGFVIHPDGWIVTAAHVIDDLPEGHVVGVMTVDERTMPITGIWAEDAARDLAIVKVDATNLPVLPLAEVEPVPGSDVFVMSHPRGHFYVLTDGMVSRVMDGTEPDERLEITADFAKGSSGAPVVDRTGSLIGIALSTVTLNANEEEKTDAQMVLKRCAGVTDLRELIRETRGGE